MKFALALAVCFIAARPLALPRATSTLGPAPIAIGHLRRVYPFSIVPGGIVDNQDFETHRYLAAAHYAHVGALSPIKVSGEYYASYRFHDAIYWTSRKVKVFEGEAVFTDGTHLVRGRCGNRLSLVPMLPTLRNGPTLEETTEIGVAASAFYAFTFESSTIEEVPPVTPTVFPPSTPPGTGAQPGGIVAGASGGGGGATGSGGGIVTGSTGPPLAPMTPPAAPVSPPPQPPIAQPGVPRPPVQPTPPIGIEKPLPLPPVATTPPQPVAPPAPPTPIVPVLGFPGMPPTPPVEISMPLPLPPVEVFFPPLPGSPEAPAAPFPPIEFPPVGPPIEQVPLPSAPELGTYLLMGSGLLLTAVTSLLPRAIPRVRGS